MINNYFSKECFLIRANLIVKVAICVTILVSSVINKVSANSDMQKSAPGIQWDRTFGGNLREELTTYLPTLDGGYVFGGSSSSETSLDKTSVSFGDEDYWIIKTDASGNKLWERAFGGDTSDLLRVIKQTSDGGFILGGTSTSNANVLGGKSQNSNGREDLWVIRLDAAGNKLWDKTFGGSGEDDLQAVLETSDGGFLLGAFSASGISLDKSQDSKGLHDYWVIKLDALGNKLWDKTFGGDGVDALTSMALDGNGGYVLTGYSRSGINGDKTQASRGEEDIWVVKIDVNGVKVWDKAFGGNLTDMAFTINTVTNGYILGGVSYSGQSGDKSAPSLGGFDSWVVRIDTAGNKLWDRTYGGLGTELVSSIFETKEGDLVIGNVSDSPSNEIKSENSFGDFDYWIIKTDASGEIKWERTVGGDREEWEGIFIPLADNSFIIGGHSSSSQSGLKSSEPKGAADFWIVKLSSEGCTDPQVNFTVAAGTAGSPSDFTDSSQNLSSDAIYEWDIDNDGIVDYTTKGNISHTYQLAGTYTAKLTIRQGTCNAFKTQDVEITVVSASNDLANEQVARFYPNPAKDYLYIETANKGTISVIKLMDTMGKEHNINLPELVAPDQYKLEVEGLAPGIYVVWMQVGKKEAQTFRFIKN